MKTRHRLVRHSVALLIAFTFSLGLAASASAKGPLWPSFAIDADGKISEAERRALLDFYASTGGDSTWDRHDGWNGPAGSECRWYGVSCNHTHVIKIELPRNNLQGTLPDISGLSSLDTLNVLSNHLSGSLAALGKLASLRDVNVGGNKFSGSLPSLSDLRSLASFRSDGNPLSGEMPPLQGLVNLHVFLINGSSMTGSIPPLEGLTQLETIDLNENRLSGSIPSLVGLSALTTIDFSSNQLTGPMPSLEGLSKLSSIKLDHNQLDGTMPDAPVPNDLVRGSSRLCPNRFASSSAVQWDRATGTEPWYTSCAPAPGADAPVKISLPAAGDKPSA